MNCSVAGSKRATPSICPTHNWPLSISIDAENVIRWQAVGIIRVVPVMFELPSAFIEPVKTATPATQPEIAACIFVNAIDVRAFLNGVPVFQAGNIMGDLSRLSIQSIQRARGEPYPQNTLGIPVDCSDPARRETIRIAGAMHITAELFLLEIENIKPSLLSSHPQHAAPVLIHRDHAVIVEAIRVALIVLKKAREMFCAPVKVIEAQTRWHPKSVSSIIEKLATHQADSTGANRVFREHALRGDHI